MRYQTLFIVVVIVLTAASAMRTQATGSLSKCTPITAQNAAQVHELKQLGTEFYTGAFWSPDGNTFISTTKSGTSLYPFDREKGLGAAHFLPGLIFAAYSPNGTWMAFHQAVDYEESVVVIDARTFQTLRTFAPAYGRVIFSLDSKLIATGGSGDNEASVIKLWVVSTGAEVITVVNIDADLLHLAFSSDGKYLAAGGYKLHVGIGKPTPGYIRVWNATNGDVVWTSTPEQPIDAIGFEADTNRMNFVEDKSGWVYGWLPGQVNAVRRFQITTDRGTFIAARFGPEATRLAVTNGTGVDVWNVRTGARLASLKTRSFNAWGIEFSGDTQFLVINYLDSLSIWSLTDFKNILTLAPDHPLGMFVFEKSGDTLLTAGYPVERWDLKTGKATPLSSDYWAKKDLQTADFALDPKGETVAYMGFPGGTSDVVLGLYNLQSKTDTILMTSFSGRLDPTPIPPVYSPDGRLIASFGWDSGSGNKVRLWDLQQQKELPEIPYQHPLQMIFTAPTTLVFLDFETHDLVVWDTTKMAQVKRFFTGGNRVAFDPVHHILAVGWWDGSVVTLIYTTTFMPIRDMNASGIPLAFSPDGNLVLVHKLGSNDVIVWDVSANKPLVTLPLPRDARVQGAFSPAGDLIATSQEDGTIRLWGC